MAQSHGVTRRSSANVAGVGFGEFQAMTQRWSHSDRTESHEA